MLPEETLRLFDGVEPADLREPSYRPFVIGRLLEDGDSRDLRWLFDGLGEEELRSWSRERGERLLSDRSRGFWLWLIGEEGSIDEEGSIGQGSGQSSADESPSNEAAELRESIWPL